MQYTIGNVILSIPQMALAFSRTKCQASDSKNTAKTITIAGGTLTDTREFYYNEAGIVMVCEFDLLPFIQDAFATAVKNTYKNDVNKFGDSSPFATPACGSVTITITITYNDGTTSDELKITQPYIYGSLLPGESYISERHLRYKPGYPFSVWMDDTTDTIIAGMFEMTAIKDDVKTQPYFLKVDFVTQEPSHNITDITSTTGIPNRSLLLIIPNANDYQPSGNSVGSQKILITTDTTTQRVVYLRYLNHKGQLCYFPFQKITQTEKVTQNDGFVKYAVTRDYVERGTAEKWAIGNASYLQSAVTTTIACGAYHLDSYEVAEVLDVLSSPFVDLYCGKDSAGVQLWQRVNVVAGSESVNLKKDINDIDFSITLPSRQIQNV